MSTYRIINPKKKNRVFFKTEAWIRRFAHTMKLHGLYFSDPKQISTDFHLFLKTKGILLQGNPAMEQPQDQDRPPVDDEQPEKQSLTQHSGGELTQQNFSKMKMKELRQYAKENGISLGQLRKKTDIIKAIENN